MYGLAVAISAALVVACCGKGVNRAKALRYLDTLDKNACLTRHAAALAEFNYNINSTDENFKIMDDAHSKRDAKPVVNLDLKNFDWNSFKEPYIQREIKNFGFLDSKEDPKLKQQLTDAVVEMSRIQSDIYEVCLYENRSVCSGPQVDQVLNTNTVLETSSNADELQYYWEEINNNLSLSIRPIFEQYVNASNAFARNIGFANMADEWKDDYEQPPVADFQHVMLNLWAQIEPFYKQYYTLVRSKLRKVYGKDKVSATGPIPIHLFSLHSGIVLDSLYGDEERIYPGKPVPDVTDELVKQNYTGIKIARSVESYFKSMGFRALPDNFWKYSVFEKPIGRKADCVDYAFSLYNNKDYRMTNCGDVNQDTLTEYVRQLYYVYAFIQAQNQPCIFKRLTDAELTEAIADAIVLSFNTNKHLTKMGLLSKDSSLNDPEVQMNDLYSKAIDTIGYIPMMLVFDLWRWDVFQGKITPENYNKAFWDYRKNLLGVVPPSPRSEEYLDAGSYYDVANDVSSIVYFMQYILGYQVHEVLCIAAGQYNPKNPSAKPIQNCDLSGSKAAGDILRKMTTRGSSMPWTSILKLGTGKSYIDAGPFLRYFDPLYKFMAEKNKRNGEFVGWK